MRKEIQALEEMARIGFINKDSNPDERSDFKLVVYTDDSGNIPHMHIHLSGEHDACIRYDSPEYFIHRKNDGTIPTRVAKQLDKFLRSIDDFSGKTQWEFAINMWNRNNYKKKLDSGINQPDYTKLNRK